MKATEYSGDQVPDEDSKQKNNTSDANPEQSKGTLQSGLKIAGSALAGSLIGAGSIYAAEQQPPTDMPLDEPDITADKVPTGTSTTGKIQEIPIAKTPEPIIVIQEPVIEPVIEPTIEPTIDPAINPAIENPAIEPATESPIKEPVTERPLDEQPIDEPTVNEAPATESIVENTPAEDSLPIDSSSQPDQPDTEEAPPSTEETLETFNIEDDSSYDWQPVNQEHPGIDVEIPPGADIF
ncbi:MAG: hypothetical protein LBL58_18645 [Tannerellaceae bacterium]|jgi:hypothetical protein|nr:hypothetical protein [Tannerellaceae bacterium]